VKLTGVRLPADAYKSRTALLPATPLKAIIYERSTIVLVAKYVHDILEVFYATPVYRAG
jgi:hypothetical protein